MDKLLTVAITTYNRKESLLETLRSFESQGMFENYKILISNNCSNYNVEEWLEQNLSARFYSIIKLYNRPYNVGADVNIAFTFQLCDTKWMWLMSDDDISVPGSLQIVLNDISVMPEIAHIKYSIKGFKALPERLCDSFESLVDMFNLPSIEAGYGQFVFMSNNVINLKLVNDYIGNAPYYAHTCITQLVPSVFAIKKKCHLWKISPKIIVTYERNRNSYTTTVAKLNFANIQMIDAGFTEDEIKKLRKLFSGFKGFRSDMKFFMSVKPKTRRDKLFIQFLHGFSEPFSFTRFKYYLYYIIKCYLPF